jgi:GGDEF domain-containing protein
MIERRIDYARRKRIAEMSPEEMRHALLVSEKTGLPNRRAFEESEPSAFVAMADLDGLKALNDKFGYAAGDTLICRFAELLVTVGLDANHFQGDEFACKGATFQELNEKLCRAQQILREQAFAVCGLDGRVTTISGADFCFGIGTNLTEAERTLKGQKELRSSSRLPWGFHR